MGETRGRRKYDREFKEDAIRLILDGGRTVRDVAWDLGIHENMLHRWNRNICKTQSIHFPAKGT